MSSTLVLIDADIILHHSAHHAKSEDTLSLVEDINATINQWVSMIPDKGIGKVRTPVVCLSVMGKKNFRHKLYPKYKANRKDREKPRMLDAAYEILSIRPDARQCVGLEADDLLGIYQTWCTAQRRKSIIVTVDKDLQTIPGLHWNPVKKVFSRVTEDESDYRYHVQWLTGDSTDNYPGAPGIGPVKAEKILADCLREERTDVVLETYKALGVKKKDALIQGKLARILTIDMLSAKQRKELKLG